MGLLRQLWEMLRSSTFYEMECRLERSNEDGKAISEDGDDVPEGNCSSDDLDNDAFSMTSKVWKFNGFQDPIAGFRGGGQLALECMAFMANTHSEHFVSMVRYHGLRLNREHAKPTFPVLVAGSHITVMLMSLLRLSVSEDNPEVSSRSLSPQPFWRMMDDEEAFEKIYSLTFMMIDESWRRDATSELNFNDFVERTRENLNGLLQQGPENVEVLWNLWLSQRSAVASKKVDAKMQDVVPQRKVSIERGLSGVTAASAAHALALAQTKDENIANPLVKATSKTFSLLPSMSDILKSSSSKKDTGHANMVKISGGVESKVLDPSDVLTQSRCNEIENALSPSCQGHDWKLLYSISRDGASIDTFFMKVQGHKDTLLIVKDSHEATFGGYASKEWSICSHYFGSGDCFLFALKDDGLKKYTWTSKNNYFMLANEDSIGMGGGGNFGIYLDCDLFGGTSGPSETYGSPMLSKQEEFQCAVRTIYNSMDCLNAI